MKIHTFELTSILTNDKYYKIQKTLKIKDKSKWKSERNGMLYFGLREKGILIYMFILKKKNYYSYRIIYRISARRVLDKNNYVDLFDLQLYDELELEANRLLFEKSNSLPKLNDCDLTRIDFCHNAELENQHQVKAYIKTIKNGYIPPKHNEFLIYSETGKRFIPPKNDFTFFKNDYVEISIYNKKAQMKQDDYYPKSEIDRASNIVRMEIRCYKKLIKEYCEKHNITSLRRFMGCCGNLGNELYNKYLSKISGSGCIYTLKETNQRIDMSEFRKKDIKLMKEFVKDINLHGAPETFEVYKKEYSKAILKRMIGLFEIIDTSFITLPVREAKLFDSGKLPSPLKLYYELC